MDMKVFTCPNPACGETFLASISESVFCQAVWCPECNIRLHVARGKDLDGISQKERASLAARAERLRDGLTDSEVVIVEAGIVKRAVLSVGTIIKKVFQVLRYIISRKHRKQKKVRALAAQILEGLREEHKASTVPPVGYQTPILDDDEDEEEDDYEEDSHNGTGFLTA